MTAGPAERACAAAIAGLLLVAGTVAGVRSGAGTQQPFELARSRVGDATGPQARSEADPFQPSVAPTGLGLPPGTDVYAVRLAAGGGPSSVAEAGGGGLATGFWPASSVKVLAAVAALEFAGSLGFSGSATVRFDGGITATLRQIYDAAIRDSSNEDYDLLVQIAGLDRLNDEFLTLARGFPETVIAQDYAGYDLARSPGMRLSEGSKSTYVPPRVATGDYGCAAGNCSNLFEMVESIRRILLDDEILPSERFAVAPADLRQLRSALLGADGFFNAGAAAALGRGTRVYSKPGWVPGRDCVDVAFIEGGGQRFLLGVATPDLDDGSECPSLSPVAAAVLRFLRAG